MNITNYHKSPKITIEDLISMGFEKAPHTQCSYKLLNEKGNAHSDTIPSLFIFNDACNVIKFMSYNINGVDHHEDGPAKIWYNEDGSIELEEWYKNGECHREGGPAIIEYDDCGNIVRTLFYLNDAETTELEIAKIRTEELFNSIGIGELV